MADKRWESSEAGAIQALEAFMAALNAGDNQALSQICQIGKTAPWKPTVRLRA